MFFLFYISFPPNMGILLDDALAKLLAHVTLWLMYKWMDPSRHSFLCLGTHCIGEATPDKAICCIVTALTFRMFSILQLSARDTKFLLQSYLGLCLFSLHVFPRMIILASFQSVVGKHVTSHRAWFNHALYSWSLVLCVCSSWSLSLSQLVNPGLSSVFLVWVNQ